MLIPGSGVPINSPRRGELNGLRGKFSRRCFFVVATVRLAKISLGSRLEKNVFEKREAIVDQRKIGFSFSTLIAHPFPSISRPYFSSPHFSIYSNALQFFFFFSFRSSILDHRSVQAKAGQDSYSRGSDGNERKCIAFAMNCRLSSFSSRICIRMQSTLIDRRRPTSRQRLIRLY